MRGFASFYAPLSHLALGGAMMLGLKPFGPEFKK